jgi:MASE1
MKSDSGIAWPWAILATFTAYTLVGFAALQLTIPPGSATPLFPSTGIALVSLLVFGWRMLPAIWLGAFIVDLSFALSHGPLAPVAFVLPVIAGFASMLQAALGAALLLRLQGRALKLTEPGEVAILFLFAGALACTIAPRRSRRWRPRSRCRSGCCRGSGSPGGSATRWAS